MSAPAQEQGFRNYGEGTRSTVHELYRLNHTHQTLDFVRSKKREYQALDKRRMTMWEAIEYLDTLVDDSDPDIDLWQIEHLLQTAEAIRADGHPRWFVLTGLIHDLGKVLCLRRAAVGRRRRHLPGRLRIPAEDRVPRVLRRPTPTRASRATRLGWGSTSRAAGWTTSRCPGGTTSTCTTWSRTTCRPKRSA